MSTPCCPEFQAAAGLSEGPGRIPTIEYKGYVLSAYSTQVFPPHRDPYAKGPRRFSSVVRIDAPLSSGIEPQRNATQYVDADPTQSVDALGLAMQFGKDIIDDKIHVKEL
ncbi:hypothetical protein [Paraburkholderia sp. GAS448]|uniref:hypothetical protein n=1 Tax=Paraburkholderia sp. GAS448 TaxID=3035136 RepID=UPI003D1C2542